MPEHLVQAEELQAYLDRELAPARQEEVERHLVECKECSAMIADLKRVSTTLQQWQVDPAPATLRPPVIPTAEKKAGFRWGRLAIGFAASGAVILIIAAISIPNMLRSRYAVAPPPSAVTDDTYALRTKTARRAGKSATEYYSNEPPAANLGMRAPTAGIAPGQKPQAPLQAGRLIAYQVAMTLEVKEFDPAKKQVTSIVAQVGGYIAQSSTRETPNQARRASLTLRVPAAQLSVVLEQIRNLGRVTQEQLSTEEVIEQVVDLEARLRNSRATEQRLLAVLSTRTGSVADILEVEREIASTRQEIERMEAQRQNLLRRVELASVQVMLEEEFKTPPESPLAGAGTRLRNAAVDGYEYLVASALGLILFAARYGLVLLFWGGLGWLAWRLVRRYSKRLAKPGA